MNYNDFCDKFIKYKQYLGYSYKTDIKVINRIKQYLLENKVEMITKETVEKYVRINPNINQNTIARNIMVFRSFCKYLKTLGYDVYQITNIVYKRNIHNFTPYIFSKVEIDNIFKATKNFKYFSFYYSLAYPLILSILYQTGMRISEVLSLKVGNYNFSNSSLLITKTKNNEERLIYLPNLLNNKINHFILKFKEHNNNYIFYSASDNSKYICSSTINRYFKNILRMGNIMTSENKPRIYDFRHTFIVRNIEKLLKQGQDFNVQLPYLQAYVGHKSPDSLLYYFRITKSIIGELNKITTNNLGFLIRNVGEINE